MIRKHKGLLDATLWAMDKVASHKRCAMCQGPVEFGLHGRYCEFCRDRLQDKWRDNGDYEYDDEQEYEQ